uniref:cytochrome P450 2C41-like n=1 Tax=Ciona intestinalis TaxID=7719 RepID=UPI000EF44729|nr:cytochrome P450 2C41-like [Ciona intestinalis]|eukprot:XP_026694607.1 cytochrome P450 2C41-like [Ciona intestinalis]
MMEVLIGLNVSTLATFLVVFYAVYYWYKRPGSYPPGPRGYPLVGVLPRLGKYPERVMRKWSRKYGPVMSVRMGRNDWVSLNDYSSIKEALVKQGNVTSARPDFPAHQEVAHYHGILFSSGDLWQNQRRFGITTLRE